MFSDILTPLPGIGILFEIIESQGLILRQPIRSQTQVEALTPLEPENTLLFVRQILGTLRQEVKGQANRFKLCGCSLDAGNLCRGGKKFGRLQLDQKHGISEPALLHQLLKTLAEAIQIFDSWAGRLMPQDYKMFALPYQQQVVQQIKTTLIQFYYFRLFYAHLLSIFHRCGARPTTDCRVLPTALPNRVHFP